MDIVVLAKYVPAVDRIPENAWDLEKGTLIRSRLQLTFNPYDLVALNLALRAKAYRPGCRVLVMSMGPPSAEALLREALAYGADRVWLLTDRDFAGSDTYATARTLCAGIDTLLCRGELAREYAVFCGMQSPDGDTAQVPAQVASMLGAPLYPYVTELENTPEGFGFRTLNTVGSMGIRARGLPFVATATRLCPAPAFHVPIRAMIRATESVVPVLKLGDLDMRKEDAGLCGSRTSVIRIFQPKRKLRAGPVISVGREDFLSAWEGVMEAVSRPAKAVPGAERTENRSGGGKGAGYYSGPCVALCEAEAGRLSDASLEIAGRCAQFAGELGEAAIAVVVHPEDKGIAETLQDYGITKLCFVTGCDPVAARIHHQARAIAALLRKMKPQVVLASAALRGRVLAPYISAELSCGLTADCSELEIRDCTQRGRSYGSILHQTRPALGGNIMATIVSIYEAGQEASIPQMATVRPGVLKAVKRPAPSCESMVWDGLPFDPRFDESFEAHSVQADDGEKDIAGYEVVVCAGRGVGNREEIEKIIRPFCRYLEKRLGKAVGLGCSRAVVDAGILPHNHQIGQTGSVVKPDLYIGIGVSGAVQHRIGMENSAAVISINSSAEAPMNQTADHVIVGDFRQVIGGILSGRRQP